MWRTRAVLSLLYEEVAGLATGAGEPEEQVRLLRRARRRAWIVVALDWLAIVTLVLLGERGALPLRLGPDETTVFTLAILAVAVHSGFRLGQLDKLLTVAHAARRLLASDPDP